MIYGVMSPLRKQLFSALLFFCCVCQGIAQEWAQITSTVANVSAVVEFFPFIAHPVLNFPER